tara:strand:+ start:359 stop:658 length:300 start_codon:yes stop_codon:yes gene_type:complete
MESVIFHSTKYNRWDGNHVHDSKEPGAFCRLFHRTPIKRAIKEDLKIIKSKLNNLGDTLNRARNPKDGVKYYWVPKEFKMLFSDLDIYLQENKNTYKLK